MTKDQDVTEQAPEPAFATGEGLRALLRRLGQVEGGPSWRTDPEARRLAEYTVRKYERLCRKWHRDPAEAATAAFLAMQGEYILTAADPWAIVTVAVRATVIADRNADLLLISTERARQKDTGLLEAPVRAGEHEEYLYDIVAPDPVEPENESGLLDRVQRTATLLLVSLGWDTEAAAAAVEYVLSRLLSALDADRALEQLRRDDTLPALLDVPAYSWRAIIRVLLGGRGEPGLPARRGLIARIALQGGELSTAERVAELLEDDELVLAIFQARPART